MRTTINLDPTVLKELSQRSRRSGKTMGQVASELLARAMAEPDTQPPELRWVTRDLGTPFVDLEDKEAVRAILESGR